MSRTWLARLRPFVAALGLKVTDVSAGAVLVTAPRHRPRVRQLDDDGWLVQLQSRQAKALKVEKVDNRTWVVQRGGGGPRRTVLRLGGPKLRTHLLVDRKAARANMRLHQLTVGNYLADEHIAWVLRELEITCVLDVGANIGQYGRSLREAGYRGRIVSFEPLPHLADQLEKAAVDDPDWRVVRCALGDADSHSDMTVVGGRGRTSSLLPVSDFGRSWSPRLEGVGRETVPVRRLDGLLDEVLEGLTEPRIYLKLDTQGYDVRALRGAGERIAEVVGMQSEVSAVPIYEEMPPLTEAIELYKQAGFELTGMFPVSRDWRTLRVIEFDAVMVRADAVRPQRK